MKGKFWFEIDLHYQLDFLETHANREKSDIHLSSNFRYIYFSCLVVVCTMCTTHSYTLHICKIFIFLLILYENEEKTSSV